MAQLEHLNVTVSDADQFSALLSEVFGWHVRWEGESMDGAGRSIHVGSDTSYVALYEPKAKGGRSDSTYVTGGGLNHIGVVVDDFEATDAKVRAAGYTPGEHHDYEPGRRFYFDGPDGIEIEVVSYD